MQPFSLGLAAYPSACCASHSTQSKKQPTRVPFGGGDPGHCKGHRADPFPSPSAGSAAAAAVSSGPVLSEEKKFPSRYFQTPIQKECLWFLLPLHPPQWIAPVTPQRCKQPPPRRTAVHAAQHSVQKASPVGSGLFLPAGFGCRGGPGQTEGASAADSLLLGCLDLYSIVASEPQHQLLLPHQALLLQQAPLLLQQSG